MQNLKSAIFIFLIILLIFNNAVISAPSSLTKCQKNSEPDLTNSASNNPNLFGDGVKEYNKKNYAKALELFEAAIKNNEKNTNALYYAALSCQALANYEQALVYYGKVVDLNADPNAVSYATQASVKLKALIAKANRKPNPTAINKPYSHPLAKSNDNPDSLPDMAYLYYTKPPGSNLLLVDGTVNGTPTQFYFDTGAADVFFSKQQLMSIGSIIGGDAKATKFAGVGSNQAGDAYNIKADISVAGITRHNFKITVSEDNYSGNANTSLGYPLLGRPFWDGYLIDIDSATSTIKFYKESSNKLPPGIDVPFILMGRHVVVNVTVNGGSIPMIFDTGASGLTFTEKQAMSVGILVPANAKIVQSSGVSGTTQAALVNVPFLSVGPIQLTDIQAQVVFAGSMPFPLLGQTIFGNNWEYIIDYKKKKIRFICR